MKNWLFFFFNYKWVMVNNPSVQMGTPAFMTMKASAIFLATALHMVKKVFAFHHAFNNV